MSIASPGCHLCFWLIGTKSEAHTTPFSDSINLLKLLTELRKTVYLLFASLLYKDLAKHADENPDGRDA